MSRVLKGLGASYYALAVEEVGAGESFMGKKHVLDCLGEFYRS